MGKKILNTLTNNIWYKLLALVLAFILWLVVYNIDDPNVTKTFTASVKVENGDALTNQNLYYEIKDTTTVKVAVTGKRSVISSIDDSDITATADLSRAEISDDGTEATVALEFYSSRSNSQLTFNSTISILRLAVEPLSKETFKVEAEVTGTPEEGYATDNDHASVIAPTVMTISGPASVVSQISTCKAIIDISGLGGQGVDTVTDYAIPKVYDEEGEQIDSSKLTFSSSKVSVQVEILNTKTVPVNFTTSGTPADDLSVIGITQSIKEVEIEGSAAALNLVSSIDVPAEVLNVNGASTSLTTTVDITEYLPEGVSLVDNSQAQITVTVELEEYDQKEFEINTSSLSVIGLDDSLKLSYDSDTITVVVSGKSSDLADLTTAMLSGTIDVSNMSAGTHSATVSFDLDNEYTIAKVTVTFTLSEQSSDDGGNTDDGNGSNTDNTNQTDDNTTDDGDSTTDGDQTE